MAEVFPVWVFVGDFACLAFFDLFAERPAFGGQALDPSGHLADRPVQGQDQFFALGVTGGFRLGRSERFDGLVWVASA